MSDIKVSTRYIEKWKSASIATAICSISASVETGRTSCVTSGQALTYRRFDSAIRLRRFTSTLCVCSLVQKYHRFNWILSILRLKVLLRTCHSLSSYFIFKYGWARYEYLANIRFSQMFLELSFNPSLAKVHVFD